MFFEVEKSTALGQWELEENSTHKSANSHAGDFFCDLWIVSNMRSPMGGALLRVHM